MNDTEEATGAWPLDPKAPASRPSELGGAAGGVAGLDFAMDSGFGFGAGPDWGLGRGLGAAVVVGGVVVVGSVVVVGAVVLHTLVEVDPVVLVPASVDVVVPVPPPDSWARLATGPSASSAPTAPATTKASGDGRRAPRL